LLACCLVVPACLTAENFKEASFTIIYSASLNGNLDGCMCQSHPRAGLVKRAFYLRLLHSAPDKRENYLLVDAGDILAAVPDETLAKTILDTYRELRYDAIAVGEQECAGSPEALAGYKQDYPLFAHNLALCLTPEQCQFFSPEFPVFYKAGLKIGLLALIDPAVFTLTAQELKQQVKIQDPVDVARCASVYFKEQGVELILLLYHGAVCSARELVKQVPEIDLVILGHEHLLLEGEQVGKTRLFSPGEEGNRLGELTVTCGKRQIKVVKNVWRLFHYQDDPDDQAVRQYISAYNARRSSHK
jgi:2',3'-cyclic-nucleotide 2'-phosphodiesterase (5'-nucleotidase family)